MKLWSSGRRESATPESFDDPLATEIEWDPIFSGASNFATHKLCADGSTRMCFRPTGTAQSFWLGFVLAGVLIPLGLGYSWHQSGEPPLAFVIFTTLVCSGFVFAGFVMKGQVEDLVWFDKSTGSVGRSQQGTSAEAGADGGQTRLEDIHALQMIAKRVPAAQESVGEYKSYELNLVLRDGQRVNIAGHGNAKLLRKDAKTLATFVGVPVWDIS